MHPSPPSRPDRRALVGLGALGLGAAAVAVAAQQLDGSPPDRPPAAPVETPGSTPNSGRTTVPPLPGLNPPDGAIQIFDVTAFGAVGDGATNNAAAFQAVQIAVRDNGGGTIYLPPGDYVTPQLPTEDPAYATMSEHLFERYTALGYPIADTGALNEAFALYTDNTTLLFAPGARLVQDTALARRLVFIAIAASNVSILGGELVGDGPADDINDVIGIWLRNADGAQIRGTRITGLRADGIRVDEYHRWPQTDPPGPQASRRVLITGCHIADCRKQSILLRGARNVSIVGNTLSRSGGHSEHIASVDFEDHDTDGGETMLVEDQRFAANVVSDSTDAGIVVSGRNPQPGIVIVGNQLLGNGSAGISLGQAAVVFGNRSDRNLGAGIHLSGSRAVDQEIVGNTLNGNGTFGLAHAVNRSDENRSDKDQRDNVVVGNRAAHNDQGQIQPDLASFDHDRLDQTAYPDIVTTNLVADNLEVS